MRSEGRSAPRKFKRRVKADVPLRCIPRTNTACFVVGLGVTAAGRRFWEMTFKLISLGKAILSH